MTIWRFPVSIPAALGFLLLVIAAPAAAKPADLGAADKAIYAKAFAAIADERWPEALALAARAKDPLLAKVIRWLDLTRPGPGRSFAAISRFLAENPDWPLRDALRAQGERAMPTDAAPGQVLAWFGDRQPLTATGAIRLLDALRASRQEERAAALARKAWIEEDFTEAEEAIFLARFGLYLHAAEQAARMNRLLGDGRSDQALRQYERIDAAVQIVAAARLQLAEDAAAAGRVMAGLPAAAKQDPGLMLDLARAFRRNGETDKAIALLTAAPLQAARSEAVWSERERAARAALAAGDAATAYRLAAAHGASAGTAFTEGEFLAGWLALRFLDRAEPALAHFRHLHAGAKSVLTRSRAAYWAASAALALGRKAEAEAWFEKAAVNTTVFYGQLAAERLKKPKPIHPSVGIEADGRIGKSEMGRVIRQLGQVGERQRIGDFARALLRQAKSPGEFAAIAALARAAGAEAIAVAVAKEARAQGVELPDHLFPVIKLPPGADVEAALVLAVIRQESVFDAGIVSPAGARGLMQLMPATAKPLAKALGVKAFKNEMLTANPSLNIRLGRLYLANLVEDFRGSYVLAIAAYNAGPTRARQWIAANGDPRLGATDVVDWIEAIPFAETRNYVMRVLENLQVYRARLARRAMVAALGADLRRAALD